MLITQYLPLMGVCACCVYMYFRFLLRFFLLIEVLGCSKGFGLDICLSFSLENECFVIIVLDLL